MDKMLPFEQWHVRSSYQDFVRREGVPLYEGSALENLASLPLGNWDRRGGQAAYTRLGNQEIYNLQIVQIPPGGELKPERHLYEAVMYVMSGRGATTVWQEGQPKHTVEWAEGSVLAIPLNCWHQEFNSSGSEPCRFLFGSNMPQVINLYDNLEFVFHNPFVFSDRYRSEGNFFSDEGVKRSSRLLETNFIPDVRRLTLDTYPERGTRTEVLRFSLASTHLGVHSMSVAPGTYATAHRHLAGAHVIVIEGQGYELLFMPGEEQARCKVPTYPYGVVAPRLNEFHQHFNTGQGPYKMLAFTGSPARYGQGLDYDPALTAKSDDPHSWTYMIPFADEDPGIREEYYAELARNGVDLQLEPVNQSG